MVLSRLNNQPCELSTKPATLFSCSDNMCDYVKYKDGKLCVLGNKNGGEPAWRFYQESDQFMLAWSFSTCRQLFSVRLVFSRMLLNGELLAHFKKYCANRAKEGRVAFFNEVNNCDLGWHVLGWRAAYAK